MGRCIFVIKNAYFFRCVINRKFHLCSRRINEKYRLYLMKEDEYHSCYALVVLSHFHQIRENSSRTKVEFPILIHLCLIKVCMGNVMYTPRILAFHFKLKLTYFLRKYRNMHACADVFHKCHCSLYLQFIATCFRLFHAITFSE